jgi:hypothetical protein
MVSTRNSASEKSSGTVATTENKLAAAVAKITGDLERTPEEMQRSIIGRILEAETIDEVFAESATVSAEEILGQPHTVTAVDFSKSRFENGQPVFAIVTGIFDKDETIIYTMGAATGLAQLVRAYEALPLSLVLKRKEQPTAQGYYPMFYVKA